MKRLFILLILLATPLFGQTWGSLSADFILTNNNGQTAGTTMTLPLMVSSSQSSTCIISTNCTWQAGGEGQGNNALISNFSVAAFQDSCSNLGQITQNNSSTTFAPQTMNFNSLQFDAVSSAQAGLKFTGAVNNITAISSLMCLLTPPFSGSGSDWDVQDFWAATTSDVSVMQFNDTACGTPASLANYGVRIEHTHPTQHPSGANTCIHLVPQSTYLMMHYYNFQTAQSVVAAYLPSGEQVGQITFTTTQTASTLDWMSFGNGESNSSSTPYNFNWMILNWTTPSTSYFWTQTDSWAGVLAPARGTAWAGNAGVVGGIPSASYTPCSNTACNTVTSAGTGVTPTQIQTAFSGAPANTCVILPTGTLTNVVSLALSGNNNVCLRGQGANNTILNLTSNITLGPGGGFGQNLTTVNAGSDTLQGSTAITLASVANLTVGKFFYVDQLGNGNVGVTDNGGILEIGTGSGYTGTSTSPGSNGFYSEDGETNSIRVTGSCTSSNPVGCFWQQQGLTVTSCNGVTTPGASCAGTNVLVGFSPPLAMSNWSTALSMSAWWPTNEVNYVGIEGMQINCVNVSANCVEIQNAQNAWLKGTAVLDSNQAHVDINVGMHISIINNYFWLTQNHTTGSYGMQATSGYSFDVENNIFHGIASPVIFNGGAGECVVAYNYDINNYYTSGGAGYNQNFHGAHAAGDDMCHFEGNIANWAAGDNVHGTSQFNTFFRNLFSGPLGACWGSGTYPGAATFQSCSNALNAFQIESFHRFYNIIGNVLGTTGVNTTYIVNSGTNSGVIAIAYGGNTVPVNDAPTQATAMLWGNAVSSAGFGSPLFNCSDVMGGSSYISLPASQQLLYAPCPANNNLPASFFYTAKPSYFSSTKPWPLIGPDVTGGNVIQCTSGTYNRGIVTNASQCAGGSSATFDNGEVNSNPAMDCYIAIGGDPYGSVGQLTFNEQNCFSNIGPVVTPNPPPAWIMSYFPFVDTDGHVYDLGSL